METYTEHSEPINHNPIFSDRNVPVSSNTGATALVSFRILVMDDNEIYLGHLRQVLQPNVLSCAHIELVTSNNPVTIMDLIEEQRFDVLLMDFYLPRLDGLAFLEWLATGEHVKGVPKIVFTDDPGDSSKSAHRYYQKKRTSCVQARRSLQRKSVGLRCAANQTASNAVYSKSQLIIKGRKGHLKSGLLYQIRFIGPQPPGPRHRVPFRQKGRPPFLGAFAQRYRAQVIRGYEKLC